MFAENLLRGKKILVTGGGTGLGKSMSERFLSLGAKVVICGRREEVLKETCKEFNDKLENEMAFYKVCDVKDASSVENMIETLFSEGTLDILVNNAAGNFISRTEDLSPRAIDAVLNIVLHGTSYVTLACGKRWLKTNHKAAVLNIVTTYATTGSAYVVPSAMAKAGVLAMTRSLAVEWGGKGIRMNAIAPGPFPTKGAWERLVPSADLGAQLEAKNPLGRAGEHIELANLASYLVSDYAGFINGEVVTIDGGEWLQGAGEFNFLKAMKAEDWEMMKPKK
ncbi:SDR family oxidoreductase [Fluviispira multicolorata]|uniref:SDR family oxidoreductase n=1 Tax=Fluviispira multicolorata TaxID=2654512 RepID=A0A833JAN7_9BACT|nr:SDR family oxidoreductase [Fluviispira multicolorata]KAB8028438.1 SDR family oxidoreductase [Fluviispira multicolorata]